MKTIRFLKYTSILMILAFAAGAGAQTPPIPPTPAGVTLVYAMPFTLQQGFNSQWRADRPLVASGYLIVLRVNPDLVYPRQVAEPVLYAGNSVAERINVGYASGYVVAIAPAPLDPTRDFIWFGAPELPERVSANTVETQRQRAEDAGTWPVLTPGALQNAVSLKDKGALLGLAADLIRRYAPDETELADNLQPINR